MALLAACGLLTAFALTFVEGAAGYQADQLGRGRNQFTPQSSTRDPPAQEMRFGGAHGARRIGETHSGPLSDVHTAGLMHESAEQGELDPAQRALMLGGYGPSWGSGGAGYTY